MSAISRIGLLLVCGILILLWLPGLQFPILSDTAVYYLLGKSVWSGEGYRLLGELHTKHLPLQGFVSYPLTLFAGPHVGMKVSSLLAGMATMGMAWLLVRRVMARSKSGMGMGQWVAFVTVVLILLHPGFVLMTMLGSADLLFAALFLASLYAYVRAGTESDKRLAGSGKRFHSMSVERVAGRGGSDLEHQRWYLAAGLCAGLSCLTRYNGLALFPLFFFYTAWKRPGDLRGESFWVGMVGGALLPLGWMARTWLLTGTLVGEYADELAAEAPSRVGQFLSNVIYYANPVHNVFPFVFPFAVYGVMRYAKAQSFLFWAMLAGWALASIWWVQAIRFAFPGFIVLMVFGAMGMRDVVRKGSSLRSFGSYGRRVGLGLGLVTFIALQGLSICLYTYGVCNAAFDKAIGIVPANMGLTSEGFYAWDIARDWVNAHAEEGAAVVVADPLSFDVWQRGVFRDDVRVVKDAGEGQAYRITQQVKEGEEILFRTEERPETFVVRS